jgi:hypothetical protein
LKDGVIENGWKRSRKTNKSRCSGYSSSLGFSGFMKRFRERHKIPTLCYELAVSFVIHAIHFITIKL